MKSQPPPICQRNNDVLVSPLAYTSTRARRAEESVVMEAMAPPRHLRVDFGASVAVHGGEAALAQSGKQTLISFEPPRALRQVVLYTERKRQSRARQPDSPWLRRPGPAHLHLFRNNCSLGSTTSHLYGANPISVLCVGLPNCEQSSLHPRFLLLTLLSRRALPKLPFFGG